jgi:ArsR family transcriptional regulator
MQTEAKIFKAMADETRLRILVLLLDGELCVCEIIAALELPQSTVSRHLAYLKKSGWVCDRKQGLWMYYRLNRDEHVLTSGLIRLLEQHLVDEPGVVTAVARLQVFQEKQAKKAC